jgi:hypothetical protein
MLTVARGNTSRKACTIMTLTTSSGTSSSAFLTAWTRVDTGLWVALRDGQHLGRVDATGAARYDAYSGSGSPLGAHQTLRAAQLAVEAQR